MDAVLHRTSNTYLGPDLDWEKETSLELPQPLPVTLSLEEGVQLVTSYWKPTPDELTVLMLGGNVRLISFGRMPMVALTAETP